MGPFGSNFIKLFRLFGIQVGLSPNWFLMFAIIVAGMVPGAKEATGLSGAAAGVLASIVTLLVYASILAHEFGHALAARAFGIGTSRIGLHLFGGVAMLDSEPRRPRDEFWITVAGPAVSFLLAAILGTAWLAASQLGAGPAWTFVLGYGAAANAFMGAFNCLPGYPMDGGRLVHSAIWAATNDYLFATRIARWGGIAMGVLLMAWGVFDLLSRQIVDGMLHLLFGWFLISLARAQWRQAQVLAPFLNKKVRDFMRPLRAVVPADVPVSDVVDDFFRPLRMDQFPVIDGDRLLGVIDARDVESREPRQWPWLRASELTKPYVPAQTVAPDMDAAVALGRFGRNGRGTLAVFEGRRLLGHIVDRDFSDYLKASRGAA